MFRYKTPDCLHRLQYARLRLRGQTFFPHRIISGLYGLSSVEKGNYGSGYPGECYFLAAGLMRTKRSVFFVLFSLAIYNISCSSFIL